jgi:methyl-accepting chemotaxis protein
MRFSNLKIATKIYTGFLASFFLVACLAANQIRSSAQVGAASAALTRDGTILAGIRNAEADFAAIRFAGSEIPAARTFTQLEANETYLRNLSQDAWDGLEYSIEIAPDADVLEKARKHIRDYVYDTYGEDAVQSTLLDNSIGSATAAQNQAVANMASLSVAADQLADQVKSYIQSARKSVEDYTAAVKIAQLSALQHARYVTFIVLGAFAAFLFCCVVTLSATIAKPVQTMTDIMRRLAAGESEVEIGFSQRRDEIGAMAAAVRVFRDNATERARLQAEAAQFQINLDRKLRETERAFTAVNREQEAAVLGITASLAELADGDLTIRFTDEVASAYTELKSDFNRATEALLNTMRLVRATIDGVRSGTAEITRAADDLSRRSEHQAASLEESAAALDEITTTVKRTAQAVDEARILTSSAREDAEQSSQVVRETVSAMNAIEASSKEIGNIIGVIDEIAFQTNLLALNAGVEAARAGDAGRGFAVVATEVRALAQRSADAAK